MNSVAIGSGNALSPVRRQAIIDEDSLSIGPLGTNFSAIWIAIVTFSVKKELHMSSEKCRPFFKMFLQNYAEIMSYINKHPRAEWAGILGIIIRKE